MNGLTISPPQQGVPVAPRRPGRPRGPLAQALWALAPGECRVLSGFPDWVRMMKRVSRYHQIWPDRRFTTRKGDACITVWRVR